MNSWFYPYGERLPYTKKIKLSYPVTLDDAKSHLRVEHDDEDITIERLLKAATRAAENYINSDIAVTSNTYKQYDFIGNSLLVNEPNLLEDSSIIAKDQNDNLLNIKEVEKNYNSFFIEFENSIDTDPLKIDFSTGYYTDEVDELIYQAILIKLEDLYAVERSSYNYKDYKNNEAFERLLNQYKSFYF